MYAGKAGLKAKIVVAMLLAGLLPLFGYAVTNYIMVSEDMEQLAKSQISSLSDIKNQQIKDYIDEVNKQVITLAENTMTINSAEAFTNAFNKIPDQAGLTEAELQINIKGLEDYYENQFGKKLQDQTGESIDTKSLIPDNEKVRTAQSLYISSNQYPLGEKDRLDAAEDNSLYSQLHEAYHPIYRSLLKRYGYYDVFLADAESGNIVYSVYKELDFGTSLKDGPYSKSNIGKVFNLAKNGSQGESYIADFEPYLPSYNANAWFIGTPLHKNGKLIGVLIFQLPVERIDSILAKSVDAESHLSAYIVDRDKNIISQTGLGVVKSEHVVNQSTMDIALLGEKGFSIGKNIYGTDVVSAYSPIQVDSLDWTLLVEEPTSSVYAPVHELEMAGLLIGLAGSGFIFLAAFFLSKGVLKQLGADPGVLSVIADAIAAEKWQEVDDITTGKKQNLGVFASMLTMKGNLESRIENERKAACENQRILQALDNVTSSVIVTDVDYNVIYHNKAFSDLVEVRREGFSHLINGVDSQGKHIVPSSRLHDELRNTTSLDKLDSKSGSKDLQENGFHAHITGSPVRSEQGEIIGGVFEWTDRTDSVRIEQEIQSIVDNAMQGDLSGRIATTELTGFLERLSSGINQLVDVNEKSISEAIVSLSAIAEGDLTKPVESEYSGIFGKLANDINTTITVLSRVVSEIGASSTTVLEASNEILEDNNQLSQRTEMQASNLEETASSMEEITTTVKQNSFNAGKANTVASEAKNTAEGGASVVKQAVSAMNDISSSSKEMVDIIGVIDEIAFQTNLLALNAAVEAARAGEQGRGFAVVASEVRNLAGRSAVAAKEIKELIQKSVDKVSEGSRLVNDSGQTLEEIILSVKEVSDIVAEIALASTEQSDGISLVNIAVSQMDEMTQKNASMVEQSVAASESMKNQAHRLNELLSFFQDGAVKPAQQNSNIYGGEERRAEVRPWLNQKPLQSQKSAVDRITSDDSHYDDGSEWAQF